MVDLASEPKRIAVEETRFEGAISEALAQKFGKTNNFLLDHYAIPPGASMPFWGIEANVPPGWLPCDGRAVSRATYANLFLAIGTLHGAGDGATTFNLPDTRGRFLRSVDLTSQGQAGVDPEHAGRTRPAGATGSAEVPGSLQGDQFEQHHHRLIITGGSDGPGNYAGPSGSAGYANTTDQGGTETRPKNISVLWIIKT